MTDRYIAYKWREPPRAVDINDSEIIACHWCGERDGTLFDHDPYGQELGLFVDGEIEEWWCAECYQERIWEI